jgi:malate permease and related proteins
MDQSTVIINRVLPIFLLLFLGFWIRRKNWLPEETIGSLRKIAVNIALPAVLFISFLSVRFQTAYLVLFAFTITLCVFLFLLGHLLRKLLGTQYTYFPYLMTGFEYGMLGISLFGGAYGIEKIGTIAITDLGHEIFIWFIFLPLLLMKRDGAQNLQEVGKSFISSPVIIAILTGILFNISGLREDLYYWPITGGVMSTLEFLGGLTVPLILLIVGYGIHFDRHDFRDTLSVVIIRLGILVPVALIANSFLIKGLLHLGPLFEASLFTILVLPPPFIIPLYLNPDTSEEEKRYINNVLTFHTVVSITLYILYFILNPAIWA